MVVNIEDCAERDLIDAYWFYEDQETGSGEYLLTHIRPEILELGRCGGVHRKRHGFHFVPPEHSHTAFIIESQARR